MCRNRYQFGQNPFSFIQPFARYEPGEYTYNHNHDKDIRLYRLQKIEEKEFYVSAAWNVLFMGIVIVACGIGLYFLLKRRNVQEGAMLDKALKLAIHDALAILGTIHNSVKEDKYFFKEAECEVRQKDYIKEFLPQYRKYIVPIESLIRADYPHFLYLLDQLRSLDTTEAYKSA
jgi:hypothetical protein